MTNTDVLLFDLKHIESRKAQGVDWQDNENILDMARYLSDINKPIWIRHVLVPGINSDEESLRKLHEFISTLNNVYRIDVLPTIHSVYSNGKSLESSRS